MSTGSCEGMGLLLLLMFFWCHQSCLRFTEGKKGKRRRNMNAHHLRNEFIEVAVFFPISKCLVQRFK